MKPIEIDTLKALLEGVLLLMGFTLAGQLWTTWRLREIRQVLRGYNGDGGLLKTVDRHEKEIRHHEQDLAELQFFRYRNIGADKKVGP